MNRFSLTIVFLCLIPIASSAQTGQRLNIDGATTLRNKQAAIDTEAYRKQVFVSFAHYGVTTDQPASRIESDESKKSKESKPEAVVWLRLQNDSPLPIRIPSPSIYSSNSQCSFELARGNKIFGLCDGSEITVWFGLESQNSRPMPYAFDFGSNAVLLPKTSVLFAVPRAVMENGNAIRFDFTFMKDGGANKIEDYGTPKPLRFRESDLPMIY